MLEAKDIDLNLLVVFQEIFQHRQISSVARRLGLSQPAVSNALARLRRSIGDELFVRTAAGMQPTARAEQLADAVALALTGITGALNAAPGFDAAASRRRFTIAMTDVGEVYFMPVLAEYLHCVAPQIQIATVRASSIDLRTEMEAGRVDLAIGAFDHLSQAWYQRRLFAQHYVCMYRSAHPLAAATLSLADFTAARHLIVDSREEPYVRINQALQKAGISAAAHLQVPHFVAVPYIVSRSDLLVTVPHKLAERAAAPFDLLYSAAPLPLPELETHMFWHRRYHQDHGNQWLRSFVCEHFLEQTALA
ncbi:MULTISPECIES: LysR family transcriptional regulator [unclassified Undibacterium]|uniref:LysR family transcriptional regulator n=1 Tax=unclassified Undibacterium TaxID=2630295 RepID=UPI002AC9449C|nr:MULTISPECIES: LysR family transcriptional regulator [unclassified Undibacterium]MEB0137404.1 LysR family transcriptional regulator [Undibacterium sp. CCC2.1]MEB0170931.1 LysR family transcriptional regulator [Undibacterium sp. CCC1.1]MEB0174883.1 LysR family transcriptional regulator [Undibacterium sp. CCC3.4]MEB0214219.1 LysR family transcriptional regulator [Undibacterium sp. 5I2]WPX44530.1 LysR family transcriptional regulator [Undibacterium sp. CCC3.4]